MRFGKVLPLSLIAIAATAQSALQPSSMKKIAEVDPRFVSYNIEAVEVTGGRFWKPFGSVTREAAKPSDNQPTGMSADLYEYRPPIDLSNRKLRALASALGPAYLRVSGTWRNFTYFQDDDLPAMKTPPAGYNGVMTRAQWKGVLDFAHATNAELVTSVATSDGTRDAEHRWKPDEAKKFFEATKRMGGHIAATEFMNEPTFPDVSGSPKGYDAAAFGRDAKVFAQFMKSQPETVVLGPGSVGEGLQLMPAGMPASMRIRMLDSHDLMRESGPVYNVFSYHFYPTASSRCLGSAAEKESVVLTPAWFARNTQVYDFYAGIRDESMPGKDMWLTETGEAGCGGDRWSSQFADTFRYVNQLGSLAQRGVKTVMQNTLAASDYAFLDPATLDPRPNYWAAVLWKRTMGTRVLDAGVAATDTLYVYAACMRDVKGGVTVVAVNTGKDAAQTVTIPVGASQYALTSAELFSSSVKLNGIDLKADPNGSLPPLKAVAAKKGAQSLAPLSITFLTMPKAGNAACR